MRQRRIHAITMEPMDQWLESQGLFRKHTARDASCLFRAVSEQIFLTQVVHAKVRQLCLNFIRDHKNLFQGLTSETLDAHLERMKNQNECGDMVELSAISIMYRCKILLFKDVDRNPEVVTSDSCDRTIMLCLFCSDHYDSVYTKQYVANTAFCQSIVYGLLYEEVFRMQDVAFAVETMLHSKTYRMRRDSCFSTRENFLHCGWFGSLHVSECERDVDDGNVDVRGLLSMGCTPFPYKVAKALDPDIYRNIEFDAWNDVRRELRLGLYDPSELRVGVKCLVKLSTVNKQCYAHIQEMAPDHGPVLIFVEDLGEKCTVPYESLEPLAKDSSKCQWAPAFRNRCRGLANARRVSISMSDSGERWKRIRAGRLRKSRAGHPVADALELCGGSPKSEAPRSYVRSLSARFAEEQEDRGKATTAPVILERPSPSPPPQPDSSTPGTYVEPHVAAGHPDGPQSMLTYPAYLPPATPMRPIQYLGGRAPGDSQGSLVYQEVNLLARKSLHLDGSDLPLADMATLRYFYNLGLDYHHMSGTQVMGMPLQAVPVPTVPSCQAEEQYSGSSQKQPLPDSTTCSDEEIYQPREQRSFAASPVPPPPDSEGVPGWSRDYKVMTTVPGIQPPRLQCPGENAARSPADCQRATPYACRPSAVPYYYTVEPGLLPVAPQCYQQYMAGPSLSYAATDGQGYGQVVEPHGVEGGYVATYPGMVYPQAPAVYAPQWVQVASQPQGPASYSPVPG